MDPGAMPEHCSPSKPKKWAALGDATSARSTAAAPLQTPLLPAVATAARSHSNDGAATTAQYCRHLRCPFTVCVPIQHT